MSLFDELDAATAVEQTADVRKKEKKKLYELSESHEPLDLASRLNQSQLEAATYEGGPLLIVAGAGSGKTRTLVHRVAYLVDKGVPPPAILLLTFTRKAAQEMLGRASALVGRRASDVAGGTFHALANMLLRSYAHLLNYPAGFTIMDQDDAESLISRIRGEMPVAKTNKRFPQKGALLNMISQAINKDKALLSVITDDFPHFMDFSQAIEKIAVEYQQHKQKNALMDFDDLLVGLEYIMREHEEVRRRIAGRYDYILVDEYQDTNPIQARLTYLFGKDHLRVTAVGDDAQSIYAFRGASFRNIMDFPEIFPGTQILKLEENYRSSEPILTLANHLIAQAKEKYDKTLKAIRGHGLEPQMVAVQDQTDEAGWVAAKIEKLIEEGMPLENIAVLFRAASHSFDLEVELTRRRIPFTKYGGRKFLESAHIKDFLSFLRVAANPSDGISLRRMLSLVDGIGVKGASDISDWVGGLRERLLNLNDGPLRGKAKKNIAPLADLLKKIAEPGEELAFRLKAVTDFYYDRVKDLYPDDWPDRQNDLREIIRMAHDREGLNAFLADMTLDPPNQKRTGSHESNSPDLTLSTIHSAKGLEWKVVFVLSAVEGRFPPIYAAKSPAEIEEERRLMYVAVTRAEDQLFIMMPLGEIDRRTGMAARPSRFLCALGSGCGAKVLRDGNEMDADELTNLACDFSSYGNFDNDFSDAYGAASPLHSFRTRPHSSIRPNNNDIAAIPPGPRNNSQALEAIAGQRVTHPVYGPGLVLEVENGTALIDFDHFGKKKVVMKYARLNAI